MSLLVLQCHSLALCVVSHVVSPLPQSLKLGKMSCWVRNLSSPCHKVRGGYKKALTGAGEVTIVVAGVGSPCQAVVSITGLYKNI